MISSAKCRHRNTAINRSYLPTYRCPLPCSGNFCNGTAAAFWTNVANADNLSSYYNFGLGILRSEKDMKAVCPECQNPDKPDNCFGPGVSAVAKKYGGLNAAAADLGFPSVQELQNAIWAYCSDHPGADFR